MAQRYPWLKLFNDITRGSLRYVPDSWFRIWVAILVLANTSPERGALVRPGGKPITPEMIADEANVPLKDVREALVYFVDEDGSLQKEGSIYRLTNWEARQEGKERKVAYVKDLKGRSVDELYEAVITAEKSHEASSALVALIEQSFPPDKREGVERVLGELRLAYARDDRDNELRLALWQTAARIVMTARRRGVEKPVPYIRAGVVRTFEGDLSHPMPKEMESQPVDEEYLRKVEQARDQDESAAISALLSQWE